MATIILTESTSDLPREYIDAHPCLEVIPMVFQFGTEEHMDVAGEIDQHEIYERLRAGDVATTSQINSERFRRYFEKHLKNGDDVLYLAFSSGLSGTCSNGMLTADALREKYPERRIAVVDTLAASLVEGMMVAAVVDRLERLGEDIDALANWAEDAKLRFTACFTVDDLKYLKRGGRISAATAALGTMLSIKPILHIDDEGHLTPISKEHGRKRSLKALVDIMIEKCDDLTTSPIYVGHGDCPEDAQIVADMIEERAGVKPHMIGYIGLVIGSHTGPGMVAICYMGKNRN